MNASRLWPIAEQCRNLPETLFSSYSCVVYYMVDNVSAARNAYQTLYTSYFRCFMTFERANVIDLIQYVWRNHLLLKPSEAITDAHAQLTCGDQHKAENMM